MVIRLKVPIEMHYTVIPMGTSKVNSSPELDADIEVFTPKPVWLCFTFQTFLTFFVHYLRVVGGVAQW